MGRERENKQGDPKRRKNIAEDWTQRRENESKKKKERENQKEKNTEETKRELNGEAEIEE